MMLVIIFPHGCRLERDIFVGKSLYNKIEYKARDREKINVNFFRCKAEGVIVLSDLLVDIQHPDPMELFHSEKKNQVVMVYKQTANISADLRKVKDISIYDLSPMSWFSDQLFKVGTKYPRTE